MSQWFRFLSDPMAHALVFLAQSIGTAGVAIIIFTLGIKLILMPLTFQQLRSARAMQALQPKIKELQTKHKADKQKLTEETMALYKEHKVNPAAGCLPLLLQMPILYGLYGALYALGNTCYTKVGGVCQPDPLFNQMFTLPFLWLNGHGVNATGGVLTGLAAPDPLHILPILCVVTQWVQQRMMLNKNQAVDPQQQSMQSVMQFMPLFIGFISWNLAAGLPLYWAVSTLFSIVQQYFITGWGSLFEPPTFGGMGGLLGGGAAGQNGTSAPPARNGSSSNGRQSLPAGAGAGGGNRRRRRSG
ncbi:MAG: YidC/Oxa1 family membrane protein insertase [Chloroflexi bacterium]|nr:YidC/Oxa1 family membrane protein insertase [Chloroflexota bacterium]